MDCQAAKVKGQVHYTQPRLKGLINFSMQQFEKDTTYNFPDSNTNVEMLPNRHTDGRTSSIRKSLLMQSD